MMLTLTLKGSTSRRRASDMACSGRRVVVGKRLQLMTYSVMKLSAIRNRHHQGSGLAPHHVHFSARTADTSPPPLPLGLPLTSKACLDAQYAARVGNLSRPSTLLIWTTRPCDSRRCGKNFWVKLQTPTTLTSSSSRSLAAGWTSIGPLAEMPVRRSEGGC